MPAPKGSGEGGRILECDLDKFSLQDGDYSMGLVDFCPVHGVNIDLLHGRRRCKAHAHKLANIAATKAERARAADHRQNQQAWIARNGVSVVRRGGKGAAGPSGLHSRPPNRP